MNSCEKFKEWLLSDCNSDGFDQEQKKTLTHHLATCAVCRAFSHDLKQTMQAFEQAEQKKVPDAVWTSVKQRIENEQRKKQEAVHFPTALQNIFSFRWAPVYASIAVVIVVLTFTVRQNQVMEVKKVEQIQYLASVIDASDSLTDNDDEETELPLETYFL